MHLIIDKNKDYYRACKGFKINGITYKRLLGTNGGVKNSTIVFVNEELLGCLNEKINNNRDISMEFIPAKLEAYKSLVCSASTPVSNPNGVIVVKDCETTFLSDVLYITDENNDSEPEIQPINKYKVNLNASDGFGLIMPQLAKTWSEDLGLDYTAAGFCMRYAFTKGMVYSFDFQDFGNKIADNYIVKDIWGNLKDVRDAELILTESMVKLWDSYKSCEDWLDASTRFKYDFCVTKSTPKELDKERTLNYQYLQPYELSDRDIDELIYPTIREIKDILGGDWKRTILFLKGSNFSESDLDKIDYDWITALMIEPSLINDPFIQNSIYQLIKNRINQAKTGAVKVHGNYSVASGDPYALCQSMFGLNVTGLLKENEIYNKYWSDVHSDEVVCFRSPMSCMENIRKVVPAKNNEIEYWYRYMDTCTIFSAWSTEMIALNGMDFDGDLVFLTDNPVLVKNHISLPPLLCIQRKGVKCVPTEEDFVQANINSFGNEIGSITNHLTAMYDIKSAYNKDSIEYQILEYRIKCGQLLQQNAIDKAKGIISKPMPNEWYSNHAVNEMKNEADKMLYKKIIADKKPYFMTYVYHSLRQEYVRYIKNTNKKAMILFGKSIDELSSMPEEMLTEGEKGILISHQILMPVLQNSCTVNKIAKKIESIFDSTLSRRSLVGDYNYNILKSNNKEYSNTIKYGIRKLYREYILTLQKYKLNNNSTNTSKSDSDSFNTTLKYFFKRDCLKKCSNEVLLCDVLLVECYRQETSKKFAWDMCIETIINNLLKRNDNKIHIPFKSEYGEFEYGGDRYDIVQVNMPSKDITSKEI